MCILRIIQENVPDCTYHVNVSLGHLLDSINQYGIDLDPDYQRGHVWTEEQEQKFVGALLENYKAIPPFWFNWTSKEYHRDSSEIVDGKQRINSCIRWLKGEIHAVCPCGIEVEYRELDKVSLRGLATYVTMNWNFVELSRKEVMQFYLRLNNGGTIHTPAELDKVRRLVEES